MLGGNLNDIYNYDQETHLECNETRIWRSIILVVVIATLLIISLFIVQKCIYHNVQPGNIYQKINENPFKQNGMESYSIIEIKDGWCKYKTNNGIISTCETSAFTKSDYKLIK